MECQYIHNTPPVSINNKEKRELEKYIKFLALKSAQIIVQSRQGAKIETKCNPQNSGFDWFNLAISDLTEVTENTKNAIKTNDITIAGSKLFIDISLKTIDGEEMLLEVWSLTVTDECRDDAKPLCTIYYRMGILLKSLISISRITPGYKLSRRQSVDYYSIYYRIYSGEPEKTDLGDSPKEVTVGQLSTAIGVIDMSVSYRTKLTIASKNKKLKPNEDVNVATAKEGAETNGDLQNRQEVKERPDLTKPMRPGAFVDPVHLAELYRSLKLKVRSEETPINDDSAQLLKESPVEVTESSASSSSSSSRPFDLELPQDSKDDKKPEELIKLLDIPFASDTPMTELAEFFKDCCNAPSLDLSFTRTDVVQSGDVKQQIEMFESLVTEFDDLLNVGNSNNNT